MASRKNSKRGFFFTVMALAVLSFMLLTVQIWVRTFEQQDRQSAETFKADAMQMALDSMSDKTFSEFANASAFYATYMMVNATELPTNALAFTPTSDPNNKNNNGTGEVELIACELIDNGTTISGQPNITYGNDTWNDYTYAAWQQKIQEAAAIMGMKATFSGMRNCSYWQIDPGTVGVSFSVSMSVCDIEGSSCDSKNLTANTSFSIAGFEDPSIARNELARNGWGQIGTEENELPNVAHKQIFMDSNYSNATLVQPKTLYTGTSSATGGSGGNYGEGQGWFYGPVVTDYPSQMSSGTGSESDYYFGPDALLNINQTILVHQWDGNLSLFDNMYGAVIVTTAPTQNTSNMGSYNITYQQQCVNCLCECSGGTCNADTNDPICPGASLHGWQLENGTNANQLNVPYIVVSGFTPGLQKISYANFNNYDGNGFQFLLFDNTNDVGYPYTNKWSDTATIWDVTAIRDMTMCGFYAQGPGPSFFQRMVNNSQGLMYSPYGIETFLTGKWAGGSTDLDYASTNENSKLDWEFYGENMPHMADTIPGSSV